MKVKIIGFFVFSILYIALQIIGAFVEFFIFGSGDGVNGYRMLIPFLMLSFQILLMVFIRFYVKTNILKNNLFLFATSILLPILMFLYQYCLLKYF